MIQLTVAGACGKMGARILELAYASSEFEVVGAVEAEGHPQLGKKIFEESVLGSDLAAFKGKTDVLIDFSTPEATLKHLAAVAKWKGFGMIIGTTGFNPDQLKKINEAAREIPMVLSPNMSIGVNLLFELVRQVAKKLDNYDIEIIETHHNQKKDAPSGTALALAKEIAKELKLNAEKDFVFGREGNVGARKPKEIGIHAVRAGDVVGDHTVIFATQGERVELVHKASSRDAFAKGALRAALWVHKKAPGLYSMKDVLA